MVPKRKNVIMIIMLVMCVFLEGMDGLPQMWASHHIQGSWVIISVPCRCDGLPTSRGKPEKSKNHASPVTLGKAVLFASAHGMLSETKQFFVCYQPLHQATQGVWRLPASDAEKLQVCPLVHVLAKLHVRVQSGGHEVRPLLPWRVVRLMAE